MNDPTTMCIWAALTGLRELFKNKEKSGSLQEIHCEKARSWWEGALGKNDWDALYTPMKFSKIEFKNT